MTKRHTFHRIAVSFLEILDILVPKIWQNGGKSTQRYAIFSKYPFCISIHTNVIEAGATPGFRVDFGK